MGGGFSPICLRPYGDFEARGGRPCTRGNAMPLWLLPAGCWSAPAMGERGGGKPSGTRRIYVYCGIMAPRISPPLVGLALGSLGRLAVSLRVRLYSPRGNERQMDIFFLYSLCDERYLISLPLRRGSGNVLEKKRYVRKTFSGIFPISLLLLRCTLSYRIVVAI